VQADGLTQPRWHTSIADTDEEPLAVRRKGSRWRAAAGSPPHARAVAKGILGEIAADT